MKVSLLDHGFLEVRDQMGDEKLIIDRARQTIEEEGVKKQLSSDRDLLRYMFRHAHNTPFEAARLEIRVRLPIFVMRQWARGRLWSYNELSGRYTVMPSLYYVPEDERMAEQSESNKQGSGEVLSKTVAKKIKQSWSESLMVTRSVYDESVEGHNLSKELARIDLPLRQYTQFQGGIDLWNLLNMLQERESGSDAQYEIQVYADALAEFVQDWVPNVYDAYVDYVREAHTFSRQEMDVLRHMVSLMNVDAISRTIEDCSNRERKAFVNALRVLS